MIPTAYLSSTELDEAVANLENEYPESVEVFMNEAGWSTVISAVKISDGGDDPANKSNVALFGGVYSSQPVGRELLLRLARHLAEGQKRGDGRVTSLLNRANVFILPAVDARGFEPGREGKCQGDIESEVRRGEGCEGGRKAGGACSS